MPSRVTSEWRLVVVTKTNVRHHAGVEDCVITSRRNARDAVALHACVHSRIVVHCGLLSSHLALIVGGREIIPQLQAIGPADVSPAVRAPCSSADRATVKCENLIPLGSENRHHVALDFSASVCTGSRDVSRCGHVRVHHDPRHVVDVAEDHVGDLAPDARQRNQIVHRTRHLAVELLDDARDAFLIDFALLLKKPVE